MLSSVIQLWLHGAFLKVESTCRMKTHDDLFEDFRDREFYSWSVYF